MKVKAGQIKCVGDCASTCPQFFKMQADKAHVYVGKIPKEAEGKGSLEKMDFWRKQLCLNKER